LPDRLKAPAIREDGLQLEEHRSFQESFWKTERFAWGAFLVFIVLALLGLAGDGGAFARGGATIPGATLDYPRMARWEASDTFFVRFDAGPRQRTLILSPEFAEHFEIEDVYPSPERSEVSEDGNRMIFNFADGRPGSIKLELRAHAPGLATYRIAVNEDEPVAINILILP
jgi:hypothetical protein